MFDQYEGSPTVIVELNVAVRTKNRFHNESVNLPKRSQILIYLCLLALFDAIIPIPITAMALMAVLFQKPKWFRDWIDEIYRL